MDRKNHWAWSAISGRDITRSQLKIHYQQEFACYVRDFPVLQGGILFVSIVFVLVNLVVDVMYAVINPRIRYS